MHNFKELKIWQKAIDISIAIYKVAAHFPKDELFGLSAQMKRAAVSISANISEGAGRNSEKEFLHFLGIANGSSYELQTHIVIANKVLLLDDIITDNLLNSVEEIQKMNWSLQKLISENIKNKK